MREKIRFGREEIGVLVCSVLLLAAMVTTLYYSPLQGGKLTVGIVVAVLMVFCMNLILVSLLRRTRREDEKMAKLRLQAREQKMQAHNREELDSMYRELNDMQKELDVYVDKMRERLEKEDYDGLREQFAQVTETMGYNERIFLSGNEVVDVVMSQKIARAMQKGIHIECEVQTIELSSIQDMDLNCLLSNVLDNAIEAVEQCEDKWIHVEIKKNRDFLVIRESNPYGNIALDGNRKLKTTKKQVKEHGFGLTSMERIAKRYGGTMTYDMKDQIFSVKLLLEDGEMV